MKVDLTEDEISALSGLLDDWLGLNDGEDRPEQDTMRAIREKLIDTQ